MCGIYGEVAYPRLSGTATGLALEAMRHRGPDASGEWSDGLCALGHRRLAIIDLSEAGKQPLANEDETVWITFNGEIYNFAALRKELERAGHRFRTRTDTEAIVHAYEEWGTGCVERLRGMFAFGIWDQRRRRLFLARDRLGKKPVFYTRQAGRFVFASELQGILCDPEIDREVDPLAIDAYLTYGYIPAPASAFRGIEKLAPGHWLTLDLASGEPQVRVERYWTLAYGPKLRLSEADACAVLREKLTEAVRLRMVSDVPLGAFLSGGIDSSIVVGLMAQLSDRPVKTYSIGFEEAAFNELEHAQRVADRWGTDHHPMVIRADAAAVLGTLVRHFGEPYADSSAIPTYYVSKLTREQVTVALNGDGADESFAGYERYLATRVAETIVRVPGMRQAASLLARVLPDSTDPRNRVRQARRFLAAVRRPLVERYGRWVTYWSEEAKAELYSDDFRAVLGAPAGDPWLAALFGGMRGLDPVDAAMAVDVLSYLPFDLLVKVDITSMATSLEARSPFLDHEVMEFAARLPVRYKLRGRTAKYLLKQAFADILPPENVFRRKLGFGIPVGAWLRGPLRDLVRDSLLSGAGAARGYFRREPLERVIAEHLDGRADHAFPIWNLLMLELWHAEMIDRRPDTLRVVGTPV